MTWKGAKETTPVAGNGNQYGHFFLRARAGSFLQRYSFWNRHDTLPTKGGELRSEATHILQCK